MQFPSTHWSLLAQATLHGEPGPTAALAEFCRRYRDVVVSFIRLRGFPAGDAEDIAHDFLLHMMEKSTLRRADATRGRFRSFLLGALVRFLGDARDRSSAAKRGGGVAPLSLDADDGVGDTATVPAPDAAWFDHQWAIGLLTLTVETLEADYRQRERLAEFSVLRAYVPGAINPLSYDEAATRLGISLGAVKTEVHRFRARFRERLRQQIALTVSSPEEIDAEIEYLGRALGARES